MKYRYKFMALLCALVLVTGCDDKPAGSGAGAGAPPEDTTDEGLDEDMERDTEEDPGEDDPGEDDAAADADPGEGASTEGLDGTIRIGILHSLNGTMAIS